MKASPAGFQNRLVGALIAVCQPPIRTQKRRFRSRSVSGVNNILLQFALARLADRRMTVTSRKGTSRAAFARDRSH